jgi:hypothetical protein
MSEGPSIQYRPPHKGEAGFGFEDGERVPIGEAAISTDESPDTEPAPPHLDAGQLLETILHGAVDVKEIAARALILGMLLRCESAPKTATEFALALDVPRTTGQRLWARLFEYLQGELAVFGHGRALVDGQHKFAANAAGTKPGTG